MRIGIVPVLDPHSGGNYQYNVTFLRALTRISGDQYVLFADGGPHSALASWPARDRLVHPLQPPPRWRWWRRCQRRARRAWTRLAGRAPEPPPARGRFTPQFRADSQAWFARRGIELMLYPSAGPLAFETRLPCVLAIHDLQHRLQPEFPEVSADGEWDRREYVFRNAARFATLLLADSEIGQEDILRCYGEVGLTADRVKVLPYVPASDAGTPATAAQRTAVRAKYRLPEHYLFYPAQFWPHKNHARIVEALAALKTQRGLEIPIVFVGSYGDAIRRQTWDGLDALIGRLGLGAHVHALGYVPDEDVAALYGGATALVMPTFFGPTNIPVLEAWAADCPVLTSDIRGIREQVGPAGLLVDPRSSHAIADGIQRLWSDANLRTTLVQRGRERLAAYTESDFRARLADILAEAKDRARHEGPRRPPIRRGAPESDHEDGGARADAGAATEPGILASR